MEVARVRDALDGIATAIPNSAAINILIRAINQLAGEQTKNDRLKMEGHGRQ